MPAASEGRNTSCFNLKSRMDKSAGFEPQLVRRTNITCRRQSSRSLGELITCRRHTSRCLAPLNNNLPHQHPIAVCGWHGFHIPGFGRRHCRLNNNLPFSFHTLYCGLTKFSKISSFNSHAGFHTIHRATKAHRQLFAHQQKAAGAS